MRTHRKTTSTFLRALTLGAASLSLLTASARADLVAYFPFDGHTQDHSGRQNHGTFRGGSAVYEAGVSGAALKLDGVDDFLEIEQRSRLPLSASGEWTVTGWIKADPGQSDARIFAEASTSTIALHALGTHQTGDNGKLRLFLRDDDGNVRARNNHSGESSYVDGRWNYFAIVCRANSYQYFLNGKPEPVVFALPPDTGASTLNTTTLGAILRVQASHFLRGSLDDVRLYDHAIDPMVRNSNDWGGGSLRQVLRDTPPYIDVQFDSSLDGQTINLSSGPLEPADGASIDASALSSGITIDGSAVEWTIDMFEGKTLVMDGVTITGSGIHCEDSFIILDNCKLLHSDGGERFGGAIRANGPSYLQLVDCVIAGNTASSGGAIFNDDESTCVLVRCTVANNYADIFVGNGGAVDNRGMLMMGDCFFSGNAASSGGAVYSEGMADIGTSTFARNVANDVGGGIYIGEQSDSHVELSTFWANVANFGGGAVDNDGDLELLNSTLSGNAGGSAGAVDNAGDLHMVFCFYGGNDTWGRNLVGYEPEPALNRGGQPQLAPLGYYGGPTPTMPPLPGADVIDALRFTPTDGTDQRGMSIVGIRDIGAAEFQPFGIAEFGPALNGDALEFTFETGAGVPYQLETSADLVGFKPIRARQFTAFDDTYWMLIGLEGPHGFQRLARVSTLQHGLTAYWSFDGDTANATAALGGDALDAATRGNSGTTTNGVLGGAATFSGFSGSYLNIDGEIIDTAARPSFTVSAWFQADTVPSGSSRTMIFETEPSFTISLGLREGSDSANTKIQFFTHMDNDYAPDVAVEMPDERVVGSWIHATVTYDRESRVLRTYINGNEVGTMQNDLPGDADLNWNFDGFHLGTYRRADDRWFDGKIDEVAVWERELSAGEISLLYSAEVPQALAR